MLADLRFVQGERRLLFGRSVFGKRDPRRLEYRTVQPHERFLNPRSGECDHARIAQRRVASRVRVVGYGIHPLHLVDLA
jgi:hypothetical protein